MRNLRPPLSNALYVVSEYSPLLTHPVCTITLAPGNIHRKHHLTHTVGSRSRKDLEKQKIKALANGKDNRYGNKYIRVIIGSHEGR